MLIYNTFSIVKVSFAKMTKSNSLKTLLGNRVKIQFELRFGKGRDLYVIKLARRCNNTNIYLAVITRNQLQKTGERGGNPA